MKTSTLVSIGLLLGFTAGSLSAQNELYRYSVRSVPLPYPTAYPRLINDSGQILWRVDNPGGTKQWRYFISGPGQASREITQQLPSGPHVTTVSAYDMNNAGVIVGSYNERPPLPATSTITAFELDTSSSTLTTYRPSGYYGWSYHSINDAGGIAATVETSSLPSERGVWFRSGYGGSWSYTAPPSRSGLSVHTTILEPGNNRGNGLSSAGSTAGQVSWLSQGRWHRDGLIVSALGNTLIAPPTGVTLIDPSGINTRGDVLGVGRYFDPVKNTTSVTGAYFREASSGTVIALPPEMGDSKTGYVASIVDGRGRVHFRDLVWDKGQVVRMAALIDGGIQLGTYGYGPELGSSGGTLLGHQTNNRGNPNDTLIVTPGRRCVGIEVDPYAVWPGPGPGAGVIQINRTVSVSSTLKLRVVGVETGQPAGIFLVLPGGSLFPIALALGTGDAKGRASFSFTLPATMQGQVVDLKALALDTKLGFLDGPTRRITFH